MILILILPSCTEKVKGRPYGYFRIGFTKDLLAPETDLSDSKLLLRRDEKGWYIMSTMCTYDLTYLLRKKVGDEDIFVSEYTESKYDTTGKVISGPAIADLPFYELRIDSGTYGGPRDTLYAYVGKEVPKEWRLPVPLAPAPAASVTPEADGE